MAGENISGCSGFFQFFFRNFDRAQTLLEQIRIRHRIEHEKTDPSPYPYLFQERLGTIKNLKNFRIFSDFSTFGIFQIVFRIFDRAQTLLEQIRIRHRIEHDKTDPSPYPYLLQERSGTIKSSKTNSDFSDFSTFGRGDD